MISYHSFLQKRRKQSFAVTPDTETVTIGWVKPIYLGVYNLDDRS